MMNVITCLHHYHWKRFHPKQDFETTINYHYQLTSVCDMNTKFGCIKNSKRVVYEGYKVWEIVEI